MIDISIHAVKSAAQNEDDWVGFCIACGVEGYDVEPDATNYQCETCGRFTVQGIRVVLELMQI